jgi:hypothetical protein
MKFYKKGDKEGKHVHKIAREYTLIGAGRFHMNDVILEAGDIMELQPGEPADFDCLERACVYWIVRFRGR